MILIYAFRQNQQRKPAPVSAESIIDRNQLTSTTTANPLPRILSCFQSASWENRDSLEKVAQAAFETSILLRGNRNQFPNDKSHYVGELNVSTPITGGLPTKAKEEMEYVQEKVKKHFRNFSVTSRWFNEFWMCISEFKALQSVHQDIFEIY